MLGIKNIDIIDPKMLIDSLAFIFSNVIIDFDHDMPYLSGYSNDGKTIYIDRHLPPIIDLPDGGIIAPIFPIVMHEAVEKALIDRYSLPYQLAHQIALRVEKAIVDTMHMNWGKYFDALGPYIKRADKEKLTNVPKELDLTPFRDWGDYEELKRVLAAQR